MHFHIRSEFKLGSRTWLGAASLGSAGVAVEGKGTRQLRGAESSSVAWQGESPVTPPCLQPASPHTAGRAGRRKHSRVCRIQSSALWLALRASPSVRQGPSSFTSQCPVPGAHGSWRAAWLCSGPSCGCAGSDDGRAVFSLCLFHTPLLPPPSDRSGLGGVTSPSHLQSGGNKSTSVTHLLGGPNEVIPKNTQISVL